MTTQDIQNAVIIAKAIGVQAAITNAPRVPAYNELFCEFFYSLIDGHKAGEGHGKGHVKIMQAFSDGYTDAILSKAREQFKAMRNVGI